jgi:hypothetical protein
MCWQLLGETERHAAPDDRRLDRIRIATAQRVARFIRPSASR